MKVFLGLLATILALSVSYYFAVALPSHNRAILDFEREKYRTGQQEKKAKQDEEKNLRNSADQDLQACTMIAETAYSNGLKSNGTPNGHAGGFSVPTETFTVIDRQRAQALNECQKRYERALGAAR